MVLTQEQRVELLAKARAAKANKKLAEVNVEPPVEDLPPPKKKTGRKPKEVVPLPEPVEVIIEDEVVATPAPKKKALPVKWLKGVPEPQKCCDEKVSKEEPLITNDEPQVVEERIVVPANKEVKKARVPRASTRTLEIIAEPKAIEEVLDEVKNNDMKYRPQPKRQASAPPPSAPVSIRHQDTPLRLFDY